MTLIATPLGLLFPAQPYATILTPAVLNALTINATTDKLAFIGYCYIAGRATGKTMGGGSSAISFMAGSVTFANVASTLDIGVQDVAGAGTGPPGQPDGSFDTKVTLTGSGLTTGAWNNITIPSTDGTKTISTGDLIAVVFDFTNRAGVDTVAIQTVGVATAGASFTNQFDAAAWGTGTEAIPNVVLTFSDGTLGTLEGAGVFTVAGTPTVFSDSTNPDERGAIFQVPWDCKVDALWANIGITDASSEFTVTLFSDPLGSPTPIDSVSVVADQLGITGIQSPNIFPLGAEATLTKDTEYAVAIRATGSSNIRMVLNTVASATYWTLTPGNSTCYTVTRDGGSGAFGGTTTTRYSAGVRISSLHDGAGGGGAKPYGLQPISYGV
jgi:hypothetical protein